MGCLSDPNAFQHLRPNAGEEGVLLIGLTSSAHCFGRRNFRRWGRRALIALDSTDVGPQRVPRQALPSFDSVRALPRRVFVSIDALCVSREVDAAQPALDALVNQTCEACRARPAASGARELPRPASTESVSQ